MADESRSDPAWVRPFLGKLAETRVVARAMEAAGITANAAYYRRRTNLAFAQEWETALGRGANAAGGAENPPPRAARNAGWRRLFLEALAESSNVSASALAANVPLRTAYRERRKDSRFRAEWYDALLEGYEHLEMETLQRLRMGTGKDEPKFDIANALRLLALHRETVARERARREDEDEDKILASLDAKIEAMRAREEAAARLLNETGEDDDAQNDDAW